MDRARDHALLLTAVTTGLRVSELTGLTAKTGASAPAPTCSAAANWKQLRRRYCPDGWWPAEDGVTLFNPDAVRTTRYRYRGAAIPSPWQSAA